MPLWRNWYTHSTQNAAGNHVGSSPTNGTNDVSVRTNRTELIQNQSEKNLVDFFLLSINNMKIIQTNPTFINGSIRKLEKTNLTYIEPHRVIIKNITFLFFNYSNDVYVQNLTKKIKLSELEEYLKNIS